MFVHVCVCLCVCEWEMKTVWVQQSVFYSYDSIWCFIYSLTHEFGIELFIIVWFYSFICIVICTLQPKFRSHWHSVSNLCFKEELNWCLLMPHGKYFCFCCLNLQIYIWIWIWFDLNYCQLRATKRTLLKGVPPWFFRKQLSLITRCIHTIRQSFKIIVVYKKVKCKQRWLVEAQFIGHVWVFQVKLCIKEIFFFKHS